MRRSMTGLFASLLFLLLTAGCGPTVKVDGETYSALTEEEQNFLVRLARLSLERSPKAISKEELVVVKQREPGMELEYTGDKFGKALVTYWPLNRIGLLN